MRGILATGLVVGLLAACASATRSDAPRRDRNVITRAEITEITANTALEVVQQLRPNMLRTPGRTSIQGESDIVVYVDGMRQGGRSVLSTIPANDIREIRYLSGPDASLRFGTGHPNGAILITIRGGGV